MEIERKFTVSRSILSKLILSRISPVIISQAYPIYDDKTFARVRITENTALRKFGCMTFKRNTNDVTQRFEYIFTIEPSSAQNIIDGLCMGIVLKKARYKYTYSNFTYYIDVFEDDDILCELEGEELPSKFPDWIIEDVTDKKEYLNYNFNKWLKKFHKHLEEVKNDQV